MQRFLKDCHFLVEKYLLDKLFLFCWWVGVGGGSNHHPIFLELKGGFKNPRSPFKFNSTWIKEKSFHNLMVEHWIPYSPDREGSILAQFEDNLRRIKRDTIEWVKEKKKRDVEILKRVEKLEYLQGVYSSEDSKKRIIQLESPINRILKEQEETWKLKAGQFG